MRSYKRINVRKVRKGLYLKCLWNCANYFEWLKAWRDLVSFFLFLKSPGAALINLYSLQCFRVPIPYKEPPRRRKLAQLPGGARKTYNLGAKGFFLYITENYGWANTRKLNSVHLDLNRGISLYFLFTFITINHRQDDT